MLRGEIISHYISIEFNVCNLELMMVCVLFTETVTRRVVGGGGGLWVVISLSLTRHENVDPGNTEAGG